MKILATTMTIAALAMAVPCAFAESPSTDSTEKVQAAGADRDVSMDEKKAKMSMEKLEKKIDRLEKKVEESPDDEALQQKLDSLREKHKECAEHHEKGAYDKVVSGVEDAFDTIGKKAGDTWDNTKDTVKDMNLEKSDGAADETGADNINN